MSYAALIQPVVEAFQCTAGPQQCFQGAPTVVVAFALAMSFGILCYLLSCLTGNDSWVDRSWSIVPALFSWFYVFHQNDSILIATAEGGATVTVLGGFAICLTIWGIRLSYNFYRRGGYEKGGEDYRWEHVRAWPVWKNRWLWHLFSFGFISIFQQLLLWAITVPLLAAPVNTAANPTYIMIMAAIVGFVIFEATADQQQWNFQNAKRKLAPRQAHLEADYRRGFLTHGLFSRSRHPNVWGEQQVWLSLYCVSVLKWGMINWAGLGALSLVLLTVRSCGLTEQLSSEKYPAYRQYRGVVPMLVPSIFNLRAKLDTAFDKTK